MAAKPDNGARANVGIEGASSNEVGCESAARTPAAPRISSAPDPGKRIPGVEHHEERKGLARRASCVCYGVKEQMRDHSWVHVRRAPST